MPRRVVHFIFGLRDQTEPFHLLHYLAVASCAAVVQPDEIMMHLHQVPYGLYWDMARPWLTVQRIEPVPEVSARTVSAPTSPFVYAHHADVVRLDLLLDHGGMYADIDTIFHRRVPDHFWVEPALIGRESDVSYDDADQPEPSMSNALMMATAGSPFMALWRQQIIGAMDHTWSGHSCRLATRLAGAHPALVHVEPQDSFSPFDHTPSGMRQLLDQPANPDRLRSAYSVHLCAHMWWDEQARHFSATSARHLTEAALRHGHTPLAELARPHLPTHGLF